MSNLQQPATMNFMDMSSLNNPFAMQMNMMNMMYMNMGMPMMQNFNQQMMMMNMMQNMGVGGNTIGNSNNRGNMFVRRAKESNYKKGNKKREPNRRRIGQGTYGNKGYRRGGRDNSFNNRAGAGNSGNFNGNKDGNSGQREVRQTPQQQTQKELD